MVIKMKLPLQQVCCACQQKRKKSVEETCRIADYFCPEKYLVHVKLNKKKGGE